MKRRRFINTLAATPALLLLPNISRALTKPNHFIGIGTAGKQILDNFKQAGEKGNFTTLDKNCNHSFENLIDRNHRFVIMAGLGKETGTSYSQQILEKLIFEKKDFMAIFSIPFYFEGDKKRTKAMNLINRYNHLPNVHFIPLDHLPFEDLTIRETFELADEKFYQVFKQYYNFTHA